MQRRQLLLTLFFVPALLLAQPKIQLVQFATNFDRPVDIAHCGDSRLFIVEQDGKIWILDSLGNRLPNVFLDIDARVQSNGNEQGLLGLAFHPNFAQNGYFYVYYTRQSDGDNRLSRFSLKTDNPNQADPDSELIYFTQDDPYSNHNGGAIHFGPDGYLYVGLGDGGSGGDPLNSGQTRSTLLGKILRLDVNTTSPGLNYGIPADNPFVGNTQYRPEIWSLGWRNPWRFSFDRLTGDMWVGDVGQGLWEEIDFEPAGTPGLNYGWRCYEGTHAYNTDGCPDASTFVSPVFEYQHSAANGCSVTGGYRYRGGEYSDLYSHYIFADYCSGRWWKTSENPDGSFSTTILANLAPYEFSAFGEDRDGELYVAGLSSGRIYRVTELCSGFQISTQIEEQTICDGTFNGIISVASTGGAGSVDYAWSNSQGGELIVYLSAGEYIVTATDDNGCVRTDTVVMTNQFPNPPQPVIAGEDEQFFCTGDSITLTATPSTGYSYVWMLEGLPIAGAPDDAQITVSASGNYTVQLFDTASICQSAPSASVLLTAQTAPDPSVEIIQGQTILCPGDSVVLGAANVPADYTYQWLRGGTPIAGATGGQLTVNQVGFYAVQVNGPCGTITSDDFLVDTEFPLSPEIVIEGDSIFQIGITECNDCQWFFNGVAIPDATGPYHIATQFGVYTLEITSGNGCRYLSNPVSTVGTTLPSAVTRFILAPNPTPEVVLMTLDLQQADQISLTLSDARGRKLWQQTHQGRTFKLPLNLHEQPAGTYYLTVKTTQGSFMRPVVKL